MLTMSEDDERKEATPPVEARKKKAPAKKGAKKKVASKKRVASKKSAKKATKKRGTKQGSGPSPALGVSNQ